MVLFQIIYRIMAIELKDLCNVIQQDLVDIVGQNAGSLNRQQTGFLDAVVSQENTSGYSEQVQLDSPDGKRKQVVISYLQPGTESETSDLEISDICAAAGSEDNMIYDTVDTTNYSRSPLMEFTEDKFREFCDAPSEYRAKILMSKMGAVLSKIDKTIIALYNAGAGNFYNGIPKGKSVNLLFQETSGKQSMYDEGEIEMSEDFADMGIGGRPIVVGANILSRYARKSDIACCNDYGIDNSNLGNFSFWRDRNVPTIAGAEQFYAWASGAVQFVPWVKNRGEFKMETPTSTKGTIIDPVTGMEFDLKIKYDDCSETWKMFFGLHYTLFQAPLDMYKVGDMREGVNNSFVYTGATQLAV